jgi:hypothetical protein
MAFEALSSLLGMCLERSLRHATWTSLSPYALQNRKADKYPTTQNISGEGMADLDIQRIG